MPTSSKIKMNILLFLLLFVAPVRIFAAEPKIDLPNPQEYLTKMLSSEDGGLEIHAWDRYVRKFRRDHHLAVVSGWDQGEWHVGRFGNLVDQDFRSAGIDSSLIYTFHIQIEGKFGYYLGTSAGYYEEKRGSRTDDFTPSSMWKMPGVVGGLVYNYDPTGRFKIGGLAYLARLNNMRTRINNESEQVAVSAECFEFTAGWDAFVSLNWGVHLQYHHRRLWVPKPIEASGYLVDAQMNRNSQGGSIGLLYHFL